MDVFVRGPLPRARGALVEATGAERRIRLHLGRRCVQLDDDGDLGARFAGADGAPPAPEHADALLVAIGRRSAAPPLLEAWPTDAAARDLSAGLLVVGDARRGALGQAGIAVGDGLAAAMAVSSSLEHT